MPRNLFVFALLLSPTTAVACMFARPEIALADTQVFYSYLAIALAAVVCAIALRFIVDRARVWVPIVCIQFTGYIPIAMYVLFMEGIAGPGGSCGRPELVSIGQALLTCTFVVLLYELFVFFRVRRSDGL